MLLKVIFYKYLMEAFGVALVAYIVSGQRLSLQEVALLGLTAGVMLHLLDTWAPNIAQGVRTGIGFNFGFRGVGFERFESEPVKTDVLAESAYNCKPFAPICEDTEPCKLDCPKFECPIDKASASAEASAASGASKASVAGTPYKLVPGHYSHRVLLPGYNECVKPANFYTQREFAE